MEPFDEPPDEPRDRSPRARPLVERRIVTELNPVYRDLYLGALHANGLRAYAKELNIDAWIRSLDLFLVYEREEELALAEQIVRELDAPLPPGAEDAPAEEP